jgi:hypothetical protein
MAARTTDLLFGVTVTLHRTSHSEDTLLQPCEKFGALSEKFIIHNKQKT